MKRPEQKTRVLACAVAFVCAGVATPSLSLESGVVSAALGSGGRAAPETPEIREALGKKSDYQLDDELKNMDGVKSKKVSESQRPELNVPEKFKRRLEDLVDEELDEEILLAQKLLELESTCDQAPRVRFRLADLYWEKSKRYFFLSNEIGTSDEVKRQALVSASALQEKTVQSYRTILERCPLYGESDRVLYELGKILVELERAEEGATYFKRILNEFPQSKWVGNSWFMIGEYYFNTQARVEQAMRAYKRVEEFSETNTYPYALYKMGWCYINIGDWGAALETFQRVVTLVRASGELSEPERRSLLTATLNDYVRAYAHVDPRYSEEKFGGAEPAYETFQAVVGDREATRMMDLLGNWYVNWDAHHDVLTVYGRLMKEVPDSSYLPVYVARTIYASHRLGDVKGVMERFETLGEVLKGRRGARVAKGKRHVRRAGQMAEKILRQIVLEAHSEAKKLRWKARKRAYGYAKDLYSQYLGVLGLLDAEEAVNNEFLMRFYFAEVLYDQGLYLEAAREYERVTATGFVPETEHERRILEGAVEEAVRAYDEWITREEKKHPVKVKGTRPRSIPQVKRDFIAACERYIRQAGGNEDKNVSIRYKMARVYYAYNHFDKAAPAFDDIVKNHPGNDVACYAANLTLDIYNGLKNYSALRDVAFSYKNNGALACAPAERAKFQDIGEKASFGWIKAEFEDVGNYRRAAEAYVAFRRSYPRSSLADDAIYNASINLSLSGEETKAQEMRDLVISEYPTSELVADILYQMGVSADRVLDFREAAARFELFSLRYPQDARARDALYNAGVYWDAVGEFERSIENRQRFLRRFLGDDGAPTIAFEICEQLEKDVKGLASRSSSLEGRRRWGAVLQCYQDFAEHSSYGAAESDLLCVAQSRRLHILRTALVDDGAALVVEGALKRLWGGGARWRLEHPRCAGHRAELAFEEAEKLFGGLKALRLSPLDPTSAETVNRFKTSLRARLDKRDEVVGAYREVVKKGVRRWVLAALVRIGDASEDVMTQLLTAEVPAGLSLEPDEIAMVKGQLKAQAEPVLKAALEAYGLCVSKASEWKMYNQWYHLARTRLKSLSPLTAPTLQGDLPQLVGESGEGEGGFRLLVRDGEAWEEILVRLSGTDVEASKGGGYEH